MLHWILDILFSSSVRTLSGFTSGPKYSPGKKMKTPIEDNYKTKTRDLPRKSRYRDQVTKY